MIEIGTVNGEAPEVALDGESLTVELAVSVAREGARAILSLSGKSKLMRSCVMRPSPMETPLLSATPVWLPCWPTVG